MLDQKTVTIGEQQYVIEQLPTSKGLEVAFAIAQILKGVAEGASDEFVFSFEETKVNVGKAIAGLISCSDIKETPLFIKNLVQISVVSPSMRDDAELFEQHFAGNYEELADLMTEIIVFNKFHDLVKKNLFKLIDMVQQ